MRLSFRITGKVQGIGYRWFIKETAEKSGVTGWVRNALDGAVEGEAQGKAPALDDFINGVKGHPWASIDRTETQEMLDQDTEKDFYIKPTA